MKTNTRYYFSATPVARSTTPIHPKVHTLTALEYFRAHKDSLTTDKYHKCQVTAITVAQHKCNLSLAPAVLCKDPLGQLLLEGPHEGQA